MQCRVHEPVPARDMRLGRAQWYVCVSLPPLRSPHVLPTRFLRSKSCCASLLFPFPTLKFTMSDSRRRTTPYSGNCSRKLQTQGQLQRYSTEMTIRPFSILILPE